MFQFWSLAINEVNWVVMQQEWCHHATNIHSPWGTSLESYPLNEALEAHPLSHIPWMKPLRHIPWVISLESYPLNEALESYPLNEALEAHPLSHRQMVWSHQYWCNTMYSPIECAKIMNLSHFRAVWTKHKTKLMNKESKSDQYWNVEC